MTKPEIATSFSNGLFEKIFEYLSDDATWEVVGENHFKGKEAIVKNCNRVGDYFQSVTTKFETFNVIEAGNKVVVDGVGEFSRGDTRISLVQACDVYIFNDRGLLQVITSYCIQLK